MNENGLIQDKPYSEYTRKELIEEYHHLRDVIEGLIDGGYGKYELYKLEEVILELDKREGEID